MTDSPSSTHPEPDTARADGSDSSELTDRAAPPVDNLLYALTVLAVVIGVAARFWPRSGLWLDEALTVNIASLPLGDIGEALRRDGHPPLYYYLLHFWLRLGDPLDDTWVRALPAIISTLAIPLAGLTGLRVARRSGAGPIGVRRTALLTAATMALMPYAIRYGAESRMYSLIILEVTIGYLLVDSVLDGRSTQRVRVLSAVGTAVLAGAMLWTHYWSIWLLAAVGLLALWLLWRAADPQVRRGAGLLVGALVVGGLLYLPWLPSMLYQVEHTGTPWGEPFGIASVLVITLVDFSGGRYGAAQLLSYLLVLLILMAAFVRIDGTRMVIGALQRRVRPELGVLVATLVIGWATATAGGSTFASRYSAVVLPLFVLCVAVGVAVLRSPLLANATLAVIVLLSAYGAVSEATSERSQTDDAIIAVRDDIAANDVGDAVLIGCPDQLGVALQRQYERLLDEPLSGGDVVPFPTAGDPRFVDWVDYAERNEAASAADFAARVIGSATADTTIYLVLNGNYRTLEGKCEELLNLMSRDRVASSLMALDSESGEPAALVVLRPVSGP